MGAAEINWVPFRPPGANDEFIPDPHVWVSVNRLDQAWAEDVGYIGPGGSGAAISGRYERFGRWLQGGRAVEMPEIGIDGDAVQFNDGRHRFAWLRDHGVKALPVQASLSLVAEIEGRFGTSLRRSVLLERRPATARWGPVTAVRS